MGLFLRAAIAAPEEEKDATRPLPQAGMNRERGMKPSHLAPPAVNHAMVQVYTSWKAKYLKPSSRVAGDYKIAFDPSGSTVSEAMGYGMLITVMMAGTDPQAKSLFDGLNRFRKRNPSKINPAFMCWKVPASEKVVRNDSATDGDMDMALALLLAHRQWREKSYLCEAKLLIHALATTLVRPDFSLRLGDWDTEGSEPVLTRPSDFMPTHFRAFREATDDPVWKKVENRCYTILEGLQKEYAPATGLVPDFAERKNGEWRPALPKALEGSHDGEYSYNSCRVPWRIGWAAISGDDGRARAMLKPLMAWATAQMKTPVEFQAGYHLNGKALRGADYDSACFITPTGVAAMSTGDQIWYDAVFAYAKNKEEGYYEDSVNLLCLLVMSGNAWLP